MRFFFFALFISALTYGQTNSYRISFENAVHHEGVITATFAHIKTKTITARMSRTSPGRYALHEFAKNVHGFKATDSKGNSLEVRRPDPYSWEIENRDGTIHIKYTLFANRADGTYAQIDETHAHLNIPATFMYVDGLEERGIEVTFDIPKGSSWKVASQLKPIADTTFYAPNLQYFMDSPTELSDFDLREFTLDGQNIRFALHHDGSQEDFDTYWEQVKEIVRQEKAVFGELPTFDYGTYTFIACYLPHVSGDGMEHHNSTILTDREGLAQGGMKGNIGTVSHEFFHAWNVERIRPYDLEPFSFKEANMSEALWFAEGFTSYYTNFILARAGVITQEAYVKGLNRTFNYVWNSPARAFFNPLEMSYKAPFVDAATTVDPTNWNNTFISYYSYGSVLGLALDLSLREKGLTLDDFMQLVWNTYGKKEVSYSVADLERSLEVYAGDAFAKAFFSTYIYRGEMPDYERLFKHVGLTITQNKETPYTGLRLSESNGDVIVGSATSKGTPAYAAGLNQGDMLLRINDKKIKKLKDYDKAIKTKQPGDQITITYKRYGKEKTALLTVVSDPTYTIAMEKDVSDAAKLARAAWLGKKL